MKIKGEESAPFMVLGQLAEELEDMVEAKRRHHRFLKRVEAGGGEKLPHKLPEVMINSGTAMLDKSRLIWKENRRVLELPQVEFRRLLEVVIKNPVGVKYIAGLFGEISNLLSEENRFLKRHLPFMREISRRGVSSVGEGDNAGGIAGLMGELPGFISTLDKDVEMATKMLREISLRRGNIASVGVLGFGEISSVLELTREEEDLGGWGREGRMAFKKMPPFPSQRDADRYLEAYYENNRIFRDAGLNLPPQGARALPREDGSVTIFDTQKRVEPEAIGSTVIRKVSDEEGVKLFRLVLGEIKKIALYDRGNPGLDLGIDAQISNWYIEGYDPDRPEIIGDEKLWYLDTTTPLFRVDGKEQLDPEVFMQSVPFFIRWIVRWLFLQDVLDRYYDYRLDVRDLIANIIKEGRPDIVPQLIEEANRFFAEGMEDFKYSPLTSKEIKSYYREDRLIWIIFQSARRIDKFITEKIRRRPYSFRLPDKIGLFTGLSKKKKGLE